MDDARRNIKLFSSGLRKADITGIEGFLKNDLDALQSAVADQVTYCEWDSQSIGAAFQISVDLPTRGTADGVDIRESEPVILRFPRTSYPDTPPRAYSDRLDFPVDDLPHLNVTREKFPAWLCLHRGNLSDWFAEHTISDFVTRVRAWYRDAASGRLIRDDDGFEPARIPERQGFCCFDDLGLEDVIKERWQRNRGAAGVVRVKYSEYHGETDQAAPLFFVDGTLQSEESTKYSQSLQKDDFKQFKKACGIVAFGPGSPISKYLGSCPATLASLAELCFSFGVDLRKELRALRTEKLLSRETVLVMVVIPRPQKLIGSDSALEIIPFVVQLDEGVESDGVSDVARATPLWHYRPLTKRNARRLSAIDEGKKSARLLLLGCGAVGSKIGAHLIRCGYGQITFVDHDTVAPHNPVRHALYAEQIGQNKANAMAEVARSMFRDTGDQDYKSLSASAAAVLANSAVMSEHTLVVDATASLSVFRRITEADLPAKTTAVRCELADDGRIGIFAAEGQHRNPRLDDLLVWLYSMGITNSEISHWLKGAGSVLGSKRSTALEEIALGVSCASDTLRLADDVISFHSASFAHSIRTLPRGASDGLLQVSYFGPDAAYVRKQVVPPGMQLTVLDERGWRIRVSGAAVTDLKRYTKEAGRAETGGLLLGLCRPAAKLIYVSAVLPPSEDSFGSPIKFTRGVRGYPDQIREIEECTGGLIGYVGEWHTHPAGGLEMSGTDRNSLAEIADELKGTGLPAHVMIVTPGGFRSFVRGTSE